MSRVRIDHFDADVIIGCPQLLRTMSSGPPFSFFGNDRNEGPNLDLDHLNREHFHGEQRESLYDASLSITALQKHQSLDHFLNVTRPFGLG